MVIMVFPITCLINEIITWGSEGVHPISGQDSIWNQLGLYSGTENIFLTMH
jgi:hypothetical protein